MKLKRLLFLGLLFTAELINAQTDFRAGYVVNENNDTLLGEIDYRGDLLMGEICRFRVNDKGKEIEYSPNDIVAYRFNESKYFVSKEFNGKKKFLEFLIKGQINIYYLRDDSGDHYFLEKEGTKIIEIPYEEEIRYKDNDVRYFYKSTKHIGLLNYYMQDAPDFQSRIANMGKPERGSLIKLAEDYHNAVCAEEKCIIYEKKLPLIKISISPFVGLTKYIIGLYEYKGNDKFINEIGGYLYLWAPRTNEKLYFKTGLVYHKLSEDGEEFKIYKIPIQIQYVYRAHRIQPNISAGVNFLSLKLDDSKDLGHTLSLNAGLDYMISNKINLSTAFNSDFTPISTGAIELVSYSIIVGLRIDL